MEIEYNSIENDFENGKMTNLIGIHQTKIEIWNNGMDSLTNVI